MMRGVVQRVARIPGAAPEPAAINAVCSHCQCHPRLGDVRPAGLAQERLCCAGSRPGISPVVGEPG